MINSKWQCNVSQEVSLSVDSQQISYCVHCCSQCLACQCDRETVCEILDFVCSYLIVSSLQSGSLSPSDNTFTPESPG